MFRDSASENSRKPLDFCDYRELPSKTAAASAGKVEQRAAVLGRLLSARPAEPAAKSLRRATAICQGGGRKADTPFSL